MKKTSDLANYFKLVHLQKRDIFYKSYTFAFEYEDKACKLITDSDAVFIIPYDVFVLVADNEGIISVCSLEFALEAIQEIKFVILTEQLEFKLRRIKAYEIADDIIIHAPFDKACMIGIDSYLGNDSVLIANEMPRRIPRDCHYTDLLQ